MRLPLSVGCSQLYLAVSQIAAFFNHQYFWKESMGILDFLHEDNQRKTTSETITFGWMFILLS